MGPLNMEINSKYQKYAETITGSQNLATLKNKIQIHGFLSFLSNSMRSDFIFRVAIYLQIAQTAHIWDP